MSKKKSGSGVLQPAIVAASEASCLPQTRDSLLEQAARGDWEPFLRAYLKPAWREMLIACRQRRVSAAEADELYQELLLRLVRRGNLAIRGKLIEGQANLHSQAANLPARYLQYCRLVGKSARFRTYLKQAILNIVREAKRRRWREARQRVSDELRPLQAITEQTVSLTLDRPWMRECLSASAMAFAQQCRQSVTRGRRREFEVLFRHVVLGRNAAEMAAELGLGRTTIAGLLSSARANFLARLARTCRVSDPMELKALVSSYPDELRAALIAADQAGPAGDSNTG